MREIRLKEERTRSGTIVGIGAQVNRGTGILGGRVDGEVNI